MQNIHFAIMLLKSTAIYNWEFMIMQTVRLNESSQLDEYQNFIRMEFRFSFGLHDEIHIYL